MARCPTPRSLAAAAALALALAACSPALDWREFQPENSGLVVTFPCRPDRHARAVTLGGGRTTMEMLVCAAADLTFAVAYVDAAEPAAVPALLAELRAAATANVGGGPGRSDAVSVPGMTPSPEAVRVRLAGRRPDGSPLLEQAVFFAKGVRVYQATVIGKTLADDAVDTFFAGLKVPT